MSTYDVIVLGAGAAGTMTAIGLAGLDFRVVLVGQRRTGLHFEGLAARAYDALHTSRCNNALATVGDAVRRNVCWDGHISAANAERIVERGALDAALARDAVAAGVALREARVQRYRYDGDAWQVAVRARGDTRQTLRGRFLIEARGRAAPRLGARRTSGPATTALIRVWRLGGHPRPMTALASFENGWAWFAAGQDGDATLQLVVSSDKGELPGRADLERYFDGLLARVGPAREWLDNAVPRGPVVARNAAAMLTSPWLQSHGMRVGDAALAIDALSGHGIFEAFASAYAAVPVVNTLCRDPGAGAIARSYYTGRNDTTFKVRCRTAREHYAGEQRYAGERFWRVRSRWPDLEPSHPSPLSAEPLIARRAVIDNNRVREAEVFVTPDHPRGLWQVAGIPLVPLQRALALHEALTPSDLRTLAERFDRPVAALQTALAWLRYRGLV